MVVPVLSGRLLGKRWIVGSGPHRCWLGTYQRERQALFAKTVSRKDTVFDIGGKAGFYTLLASRLVGRHGKVFVFEPLPRNLDTLQRHLELNRCRNVTVIEAALSYKNGFALLDANQAEVDSSEPLRVITCTLDTMLELGQIPLPDVIRLDIGGGEFAALTGAKALLTKARPTIFLSTHGEIPHRECCAFLDLLGYRLEPIDRKPLGQSREILATHF
jgi:FkbM family methyltransferase